MTPDQTNPVDPSRNIIAKIVLYGSGGILIAIVALVVVSITHFEGNGHTAVGEIREIFNALLPVIASWVGTVIAFYFGKENFESASRQLTTMASKITPDMYKDVPVKQVMIDYDTMLKFCNGTMDTPLNALSDDFSRNSDKSRLPVVDVNANPLFIIHKDEFNNLIANSANSTLPISSFKQYGYNEPKGFVVIPESATLKDAQQAYAKIPTCQDVFVTKNGTATEPLLGWLTDGRILNFLQ